MTEDFQAGQGLPADSGRPGSRYLIKGGAVLSLDPEVGDLERADVLVDGARIAAVGPDLHVPDAAVLDARGRIVLPGFVDTHHHQFETALRGALPDALLFDDGSGSPSANPNYGDFVLGRMAPLYRPEDVRLSTLFAGLAQLDAGVTTVLDISQIHHTPEHTDAAVTALREAGRRAVLSYAGGDGRPGSTYPEDARAVLERWFASDGLVTMAMGGEMYLDYEALYSRAWELGRELGLRIVAHAVSGAGTNPVLDRLARDEGGVGGNLGLGPDNLFIHMTGVGDETWRRVRDAGARVSIAFPIEMAMRHGTPPILTMQALGMEPSLSSDVETTMPADPFTLMRSALTMQRMVVNERVLARGDGHPPNHWPPPAEDDPPLLTARDVLRFATLNGARDLGLDHRTGSLTPGKDADVVLLDATALNVAPLNSAPGAVVALMDRSNVETVIVAGRVRKWRGRLLDVDVDRLRHELEDSRDHLFRAAGLRRDLFGRV
ncbi:amidohydrolase family protein [Actinosynnema pretiosum subsp. pretiosum]|uniref:Amidohydrolase family protein n=1 Tax=Actinosynnema pretiosum subsp. pretiosum TaxID=103721 RepID=A0AA45L6R3_9PSEU|nr:hypothetical protein APASM_4792 [Actinosynnema pretiosum subsp. pretiosum]QUF03883.1 amidohydrolase family protein [Actinosynnema pretiosum subsp. pretiosum]